MSFKGQLEEDLHTVFFNPAEFGECLELAGHEGVPVCLRAAGDGNAPQ